jgi:SpoVK/Ycf46/Vps4 family AAA+-type ATPase
MVVTGQSLLHVKTICNLARMLQPSLLVLEDVDLIFASREINLYSTALGDLMDELDGFQSDEPVTFLLTTNAIDRLEQAIKDRPGRINQCIYFGPPNATLRKLYIQRYLLPYDASQLDLDAVVAETRGTSQAFLKELIFRAVQIALEDAGRNGELVSLRNVDFTAAMKEMTQFDEKATGSIMGFRMEG